MKKPKVGELFLEKNHCVKVSLGRKFNMALVEVSSEVDFLFLNYLDW